MSRNLSGVANIVFRQVQVENYILDDGLATPSKWLTSWPMRSTYLASDGRNFNDWAAVVNWEVPTWLTPRGGSKTGKLFAGYTRDRNGNVLGGCTVYLVHTSDGVREATVTSDNSTNVGYFELISLTTDAYYIEAFDPSGNPAGITANNLTGV